MNSPEFASDPEADEQSLDRLITVLTEASEAQRHIYGHAGGFTMTLNDSESLSVCLRPIGSEQPVILDWLTRQPLEHAVAQYLLIYEDPNRRATLDPLVVQAGIKEVWILQTPNGLTARKRIYSYEQPNFTEVDKLGNPDYANAMDRFEERRSEHRLRQGTVDAEEEMLGLNRVSQAEVEEMIALIARGELT